MTKGQNPQFEAQVQQNQMHDGQNPLLRSQIQQNQMTEENHPLFEDQILQNQMIDGRNQSNQYHGLINQPKDLTDDQKRPSAEQNDLCEYREMDQSKDSNDAPPQLPKKRRRKLTAQLTKEVSTFDSKEEEIFEDHAVENHPLSYVLFATPKNVTSYLDKFDKKIIQHSDDNKDYDFVIDEHYDDNLRQMLKILKKLKQIQSLIVMMK